MDEPARGGLAFATSDDALLGGRLILRQPARGHRVGTDAILLAAAAPAAEVSHLVDVGAGVGAVGLALLGRLAGARADLVERDADSAALASENAARNGFAAQTRVFSLNIFAARERRAAGLADEAADLVVTNPPFFEARRVRASPEARRAGAYVFADDGAAGAAAAPLARWIVAALSLLQPGGRFVMIHRPDALTGDPRRDRAAARRGGGAADPSRRRCARPPHPPRRRERRPEPARPAARTGAARAGRRLHALRAGAASGRGAHRLGRAGAPPAAR